VAVLIESIPAVSLQLSLQFPPAEIYYASLIGDAPEEPTITTVEQILGVECDISATTDCMTTGIMSVRTLIIIIFMYIIIFCRHSTVKWRGHRFLLAEIQPVCKSRG
jgi:hypothetical protein